MTITKELIEAQQAKTDELIENLKPLAREMIQKAWDSGALDENSDLAEENFLLAKMIVTILENQHHYYPMASQTKREMKNLEKFI